MDNTVVLPVHVFKSSFHNVIELLNENEIKYQMRTIRSGSVMASSGVIEVIVNASMWASLAAVVATYIKAKNGREVMIKTKNGDVVHAKKLNDKQLNSLIREAKDLTVIDTK